MKKNLHSIFTVIVFPCACLFIGAGSYHLYEKYKESTIHPGQVYSWTIGKNDPFVQAETRIWKVVDVKDGYVQYVDSASLDTSSTRVTLFLHDANLVNK